MNRRSFLLGTAAVAIAPVAPAVAAPARAVGFNPLLAAPYRIIPTCEARVNLFDDLERYAQLYRSHIISRATICERATVLTGLDFSEPDFAAIEARVLARDYGLAVDR